MWTYLSLILRLGSWPLRTIEKHVQLPEQVADETQGRPSGVGSVPHTEKGGGNVLTPPKRCKTYVALLSPRMHRFIIISASSINKPLHFFEGFATITNVVNN